MHGFPIQLLRILNHVHFVEAISIQSMEGVIRFCVKNEDGAGRLWQNIHETCFSSLTFELSYTASAI